MHLCASKLKDVTGNKCETCFTSASWLTGLSQWEAALWAFSKMEKHSSVQPEHNPGYKDWRWTRPRLKQITALISPNQTSALPAICSPAPGTVTRAALGLWAPLWVCGLRAHPNTLCCCTSCWAPSAPPGSLCPAWLWGGDIWDSPATSSCPRASCLPWPFRSPGWQLGSGPHFSAGAPAAAFQIPGSPEGCPPYQSKQEEKCNITNNPGIRLWVAMGNRDPNKQ